MGLIENHPHTWPTPFQPLEHRNFRYVWIGTFISNAGSWMQRTATGWLVLTLTGSAAWLGIDALAAGLPALLLLPLGGAIADRLDRRIVLIATNAVNAVLAALLAVAWWSDTLHVWHIITVSFVSGIVTSMMAPASQSLLPSLAGEDHIRGAVALNSIQYNVARAIGPMLGGIALAWGGPGWCFALNGVSFFALIAAFVIIRTVPKLTATRTPLLVELRDGIAFMFQRADLRLHLGLVGLAAFLGAPAVSLLPALAKDVLHQDASAYSVLLTAFGIGAAVIGLIFAFRPSLKSGTVVAISLLICVGIFHAALGYVGRLPLAAIFVGVIGACFVGAMIELGTLLLQETPDLFRGRISSIQQLIFRAGQPLGGFVAGLLAAYTGTANLFILFGTLMSLGTITSLIARKLR